MKPAALAISILAAALFAGAPALVDAAEPTKAQQAEAKIHFEEAQKQYKLGRFEEAFAEYQRAYELAPFADLLFNMGQCRRNLKDYDRALFFFKSYVREAPSAEDRERVNQLITQLEEERRREQETAARPVETSSIARTSTASQIVREMPPPPVPSISNVTSTPQPEVVPLEQKWWFWAAIGTAVVFVTTAVVIAAQPGDQPGRMGSLGTIVATE